MYHDRYSRRRATDSFHQPEETTSREVEEWSWKLFLGILLVQVTSRCLYASLGVIIAHLFLDQGPSWELLTTPLAYTIAWGLTEPWVIRLCHLLNTSHDYMYLIMAGTILGWLGTLICVKLPIQFLYLSTLVGFVGGFGANVTTTATMCLLQEYYPKRPRVTLRTFEHAFSSITFSLMPIVSNCILETFGHHGGLLIHSAIIMQGLIGAALLKGTQWSRESFKITQNTSLKRGDEKYLNYNSNSEASSDDEGLDKSDVAQESIDHLESEEHSMKNKRSLNIGQRMAFGLRASPDTPPEKRRRRSSVYRLGLANIMENIEEEEAEEERIEEADETENDEEKDEEKVPDELVEAAELRVKPTELPIVNPIEKPRRSFQHVFSPDKVLQNEADRASIGNVEYDVESASNIVQTETTLMSMSWRSFRSFPLRRTLTETLPLSWSSGKVLKKLGKQFTNPYLVPAAFLLFSTQSAIFTFISLTPVLLDEYIDDATKMDGAYCVCVMGFTWLCFVVASPCFTCIENTANHQAICVITLLTSSVSLYMVSQSTSLDAMVFHSSLFGLSFGITSLTAGTLMEVTIGPRKLYKLSILISIFTAIFHLLSIQLISLMEWADHLIALYIFPAGTMVISSLMWGIHGCVASLRAKRGRHDITWSRRRRFS